MARLIQEERKRRSTEGHEDEEDAPPGVFRDPFFADPIRQMNRRNRLQELRKRGMGHRGK